MHNLKKVIKETSSLVYVLRCWDFRISRARCWQPEIKCIKKIANFHIYFKIIIIIIFT